MNITRFFAQRRRVVLALAAGLLAAACVPIRQEASWPALRLLGDEQNILLAYNDRVVMVNPEDGVPVRLRNADGEIRLDEAGNARLWEFRGPEGTLTQFYSAPVPVSDDALLIASHTERLFQVDIATARADRDADGTEISGQVVADPVVGEELVYVGLSERDLVALSRADQTERWRFETNHGVWSEPLLVDDALYFTSLDHQLYALDAATGDELWRVDLQGAAPEEPVYYEGRLYVGSFARKVFEISLDGEILSEFSTRDWVWETPVVVDDVLYAGDLSGMVYALDISGDGLNPLWQAQVSGRAIGTTPVVSGDYVIVGSRENKVYWLSREDGSTFFSRDVGGEVLSDLLIVEPNDEVDIPEPLLIVSTPTLQEVLVAFTLQNGERVWTYAYS